MLINGMIFLGLRLPQPSLDFIPFYILHCCFSFFEKEYWGAQIVYNTVKLARSRIRRFVMTLQNGNSLKYWPCLAVQTAHCKVWVRIIQSYKGKAELTFGNTAFLMSAKLSSLKSEKVALCVGICHRIEGHNYTPPASSTGCIRHWSVIPRGAQLFLEALVVVSIRII